MLISIAGVLVLALLLTAASWSLIRRRYLLETPADERHRARTSDGWDLALYRYRPEVLAPGREPIILCHGMLSNRFNVDLDERGSLARYLKKEGFDAWVMELRGHGGSRRLASRTNGAYDWNVDDYIVRDLQAVIDKVREITGSRQVHWFGHSMGGMVLYGACALDGTVEAIRSAVLSDAPSSFRPLRRNVTVGRIYGRLFSAVPPTLVLRFLGPAAWLFPALMRRRYGIGERRLVTTLLANAIEPWGSSQVLLHMCDMLGSGRFLSADGRVDYEQGASRISFPLLVLSSPRKIMKEEAVLAGLDAAPSKEKKYVRFSRSNGYTTDYTHSNLLLSYGSREEVFPEIAAWFRRHSSG